MNKKVVQLKLLLQCLLLVSLIALFTNSAVSDDGLKEYGLDAQGLEYKNSYDVGTSDLAVSQQPQGEAPALLLNIDYQDKPADLFSPHHSLNTELDPKQDNRSQEYETRMDYRFDYLVPKAAFKYSPDSYGMGKYYNYELGIAVPVKDIFSLETHYGWNKFDKKPEEGGMENYQDWSIGVATTYKGMKLKVDYIDINASENSEECKQSFPCEAKTVFSIIKNF